MEKTSIQKNKINSKRALNGKTTGQTTLKNLPPIWKMHIQLTLNHLAKTTKIHDTVSNNIVTTS